MRCFQFQYFSTFPFIAYSPKHDGAFCKFCVLFAPPETYNIKHGAFVVKPFRNWKDFAECARNHSENAYHQTAMETADTLQNIVTRKRKQLDEEMNETYAKRKKIVYDGIVSIARAIIFCGVQGIALRGSDDDRVINPTDDYFASREDKLGNFNSILHLQCLSGDQNLVRHLLESARNAKFCTHYSQNEMIEIAGKMIQEKIVERVRRADFFSVMADETTHVFKRDQFCLVLRYFLAGRVYEDFLEYVDVSGKTTGEALADVILQRLVFPGLDPNKLRGQGYDGASSMSGKKRSEIQNSGEVPESTLHTLRRSHTEPCYWGRLQAYGNNQHVFCC